MTFYEAALQILAREGKPLHAKDITEIAIRENLLSHVGKQPEQVMASRLASMARRSQDRRLIAVEPDTFALTDWNIPGSPEALEQSGVEVQPDENEPPLRGRERHPKIDKENVRIAGRGDRRRKYEELERKRKKKKKRLAPLPELVYEILDRAGRAVPVFELAAAIREHDLVGEDIGREALENALRAENEKREAEGRSPIFAFPEGGLINLSGREEPEEEVDRVELVATVVARLAEERKPAVEAAAPVVVAASTVDTFVAQERERAITQLRQRLLELEAPALEAVVQRMLEVLGYRDVRMAKRHKDGGLLTTRRRMGLTEVRFAIRVLRGGRDVRREDVIELRRDMQSHSAQMGVIVSPSDPTREARSEAAQSHAALVTLLCADALADQMVERGLGVRLRTVTVAEFDPAALRSLVGAPAAAAPAAGAAEPVKRETAAERRERRERERREWREKRAREREERRAAREAAAAAAAAEAGGEAAAGGEEEELSERCVLTEPCEPHAAAECGVESTLREAAATAIDLGEEETVLEAGPVEAEAEEALVAAEEAAAEVEPAPEARERPRRRRRRSSRGSEAREATAEGGPAEAAPPAGEAEAVQPATEVAPPAAEPVQAAVEAVSPVARAPAVAAPAAGAEGAQPAAEGVQAVTGAAPAPSAAEPVEPAGAAAPAVEAISAPREAPVSAEASPAAAPAAEEPEQPAPPAEEAEGEADEQK